MIPDSETLEELARRARVERSLYIAELIAVGLVAFHQKVNTAWDRAVSLLRSRPAAFRRAVAARR